MEPEYSKMPMGSVKLHVEHEQSNNLKANKVYLIVGNDEVSKEKEVEIQQRLKERGIEVYTQENGGIKKAEDCCVVICLLPFTSEISQEQKRDLNYSLYDKKWENLIFSLDEKLEYNLSSEILKYSKQVPDIEQLVERVAQCMPSQPQVDSAKKLIQPAKYFCLVALFKKIASDSAIVDVAVVLRSENEMKKVTKYAEDEGFEYQSKTISAMPSAWSNSFTSVTIDVSEIGNEDFKWKRTTILWTDIEAYENTNEFYHIEQTVTTYDGKIFTVKLQNASPKEFQAKFN